MVAVPVSEAARRLGMSNDSVRRRVKAGTLSARPDSRGRLLVDVDATTPETAVPDATQLATQLDAERRVSATLAAQLAAEREAARELRVLLLRQSEALARLLPAPAGGLGDDLAPSGAGSGTATAAARRRWWRPWQH